MNIASPKPTPQLPVDPAETSLRLARLAARAAVVVGIIVLSGWALDLPSLESVIPGLVSMKPLAALCLVLAGAALEALGRGGTRAPVVARAGGGLVAAVGTATLAQYIFAADFGLDLLLFRGAVEAGGGLHPGRMSPATALGLTLLGGALVLRPSPTRAASVLTQICAVCTALIGLLAVLGYAYGEQSLYRIATYTAIALHTAVLLCALGLGVLAVRPREGLLAVITSPHGGGVMARRILPLAILLPLTFGWLRLQGERAGWYGLEFGLALFAFSSIALFLVLVWFGARALNRTDAARAAGVERLRASAQLLADAQATAHLGSWEMNLVQGDHRWSEELFRLIARDPAAGPPSPEEFMRQVHPEDRPGLQRLHAEAIGQGRPFSFAYRYLRGPDELRWFEVRARPVTDAQGRVIRLTGTVLDITTRQLAEQALAAERARARALARRLLEVQESERRQLARDLHDELGQTLTALKINLLACQPAAAPLPPGLDLIDRALQQTRALSLSLRPPLLDDLGLVAALRWLTDQQARETGRAITLTVDPLPFRPRPEIETACFRIAQEALTNALRYSPGPVALGLRTQDGRLLLTARDEGPGFDHAAARTRAVQGGSLGLLGMEERAALAGGAIEWRTAPGHGTEVCASFPLPVHPGAATFPS